MKKLLALLLALSLLASLTACVVIPDDAYVPHDTKPSVETTVSPETTQPAETTQDQLYLDPDGTYDTKDEVALYIHLYGTLPSNYVTKRQAESLYGWSGGALDAVAPGMAIGGDTFGNREGLLPKKSGRTWKECDIGTIGKSGRGAERIVFSNDGLVYYTNDHYETFELLYGDPNA